MARRRKGRQIDNTKRICKHRWKAWRKIFFALICRRVEDAESVTSELIISAAQNYVSCCREYRFHVIRTKAIATLQFNDNFKSLSDSLCLSLFRFRRKDIQRMVRVCYAHGGSTLTTRNRYRTTSLLSFCVVLRRLGTPFRWTDVETFFGKHASQLSEIYWEALEQFYDNYGHLLSGDITLAFITRKAADYANSIHLKTNALENCIGFIDGTVLKIARPSGHGEQNVVYNGHKRAHSLKFQAVTTPDGMFLHIHGPLEGRRHDWTLYVRSCLDQQLENSMNVAGVTYCLYGDSGYNWREFMEVPFTGAALNDNQAAFNKAMALARVTVEWMFKEIKQYWTTVDFKRKMKVGEAPVGKMYLCAILLTNFRNCFYPNETSQYFNCEPPTFEDYLEWKEE